MKRFGMITLKLTVAFAAVCFSLSGAGNSARISSVDATEAARMVNTAGNYESTAAAWIWTDKYVYQPGEKATVKWTVKPLDDVFPYTMVVFLQNNQTGAKTYFPKGTSEVTDFYGAPVGSFNIFRLPGIEKGTLLGDGGLVAGSPTIPDSHGMYTIVVQLRDYTGSRVIKAMYAKIGVVSGMEDLTGNVESDRTLTNDKAYKLSGIVYVKNKATLTIQPGTFIIGQPGSQPPSALIVTREGKLIANGSRARPIIMTSSLPFGQRKGGDWGGLILLGKAPTNWPAGTGNIEGLPPTDDTAYGGTDPKHNCGTLRYVRVEFAGAEFLPNNEVNAVTWGGCGSDTVTEFVQARYGFDDNFEWFGGNNTGKFLVSNYARDDHFDGQIGWTGGVQFGLATANKDNTNRGIELDNNEVNNLFEPFSNPTFANLTFVGVGDLYDTSVDEGAGVAAIWLRRGTRGLVANTIASTWVTAGITAADTNTQTQVTNNLLTIDGLILFDNGKKVGKENNAAGQAQNAFTAGWLGGTSGTARNVSYVNPQMRRPLEYNDPDYRPVFGSPIFSAIWNSLPDNGWLIQSANFIGAFGEDNWTEEWATFISEEDLQ